MRLVDSIHERRARSPTVRISVRRSEQKRSCAANTAGCSEKSYKTLLREEHSFRHSSAMRSVWDQSDHRQSDRNNRARDREIITLTQPFRRKAHVSALELGQIGLWLAILPLACSSMRPSGGDSYCAAGNRKGSPFRANFRVVPSLTLLQQQFS